MLRLMNCSLDSCPASEAAFALVLNASMLDSITCTGDDGMMESSKCACTLFLDTITLLVVDHGMH